MDVMNDAQQVVVGLAAAVIGALWAVRTRDARGRPVGAAGGSNAEPGPIAAVKEKVSTRTHVLSENSKKIIDPENGPPTEAQLVELLADRIYGEEPWVSYDVAKEMARLAIRKWEKREKDK